MHFSWYSFNRECWIFARQVWLLARLPARQILLLAHVQFQCKLSIILLYCTLETSSISLTLVRIPIRGFSKFMRIGWVQPTHEHCLGSRATIQILNLPIEHALFAFGKQHIEMIMGMSMVPLVFALHTCSSRTLAFKSIHKNLQNKINFIGEGWNHE